jgi:DNA repair protein RadC
MQASAYQPVQFRAVSLKQVVWRFRDIEEIPSGFSKKTKISQPEDMKQFSFLFNDLVTERFVVFVLSSSREVQVIDIVSEGILNASVVHPREVFRTAILGAAASIIVAHNHPSGNPKPSAEDIRVTQQLVEAGKILDIKVLDHVIFTGDEITSLANHGLI